MNRHTNNIIPGSVRIAARRAFIRTTLQGYAAAIPVGGVSATAILTLIENPDIRMLVVTGIAAILSPLLAGSAAWLDITYKGIPSDYIPTGYLDTP